MRRLLLLRHAKAEPAGNRPDFDRTLADRGRRNARSIGGFIAREGLAPAFAVVSPASRTVETWKVIQAQLPSVEATIDPRLYGASEATLLSAVHSLPAKYKSAMLIGHNPGLARLALILAGSGGKRELRAMYEKFPTCAFAVLDFDIADWKDAMPGGGMLKYFVTPKDLAEK
jgi:phosphohistidine phosphatase